MKREAAYFQNFLYAGKLAKEVRAYGKSLIVAGASYQEILKKIRKKIFSLGAIPAFPPQIALDNVAAHFLLTFDKDIILSQEVVKLDIGVCYRGAIADCAVTIDLSGQYLKLIEAVETALIAAEKSIHVGQLVSDIGKIINQTIASFGFKSVKNLCGHGLGYYQVHTSPLIPNYQDKSKAVIKPEMTFAIEPFATNGEGYIYEGSYAAIFCFKENKPALLQNEILILEKVQSFCNLPFSLEDLLDVPLEASLIQQILKKLVKKGVLESYPELLEAGHGIVAQAENSVYVDSSGEVTVTTR